MIALINAYEVRVGDMVIPEEYDLHLQPEDYDAACAVEVLAVESVRGFLDITVPGETWRGYGVQMIMVVR